MATLYESYTTGADAGQIIDNGSSGSVRARQGFTPSTIHILSFVKVLIYKVGNPGTVEIQIDVPGSEDPHNLGLFDGDNVTTDTDGAWITVALPHFVANPQLPASICYMNMSAGANAGASNYIVWKLDASSPTYTGGNFATYLPTTWTEETGKDALFEEWGMLPQASDQTIARDKVTLEAIRNIEMAYAGRFFISKSGDATYQTRYHRNV